MYELQKQLSLTFDRHQREFFEKRHVPSQLYQYTDVAGLRGILEYKKWRATHYRFLNDGLELTYGDNLITNYLMKRRKSGIDSRLLPIYKHVLGETIEDGKRSISKVFGFETYIASFSEHGNWLDQWRAYGHDGYGYAIGINPHRLNRKNHQPIFMAKSVGEVAFVQVIYSEDEQDNLVSNLVQDIEQAIIDNIDRVDMTQPDVAYKFIANTFGFMLFQLTLFLKHSAFENEKEWRVVVSQRRHGADLDDIQKALDVKFRQSATKLVPYIELAFTSADNAKIIPVSEIYLGPKQDQNGKLSLEMFLQSNGYRDCMPKLVISDIPYQ